MAPHLCPCPFHDCLKYKSYLCLGSSEKADPRFWMAILREPQCLFYCEKSHEFILNTFKNSSIVTFWVICTIKPKLWVAICHASTSKIWWFLDHKFWTQGPKSTFLGKFERSLRVLSDKIVWKGFRAFIGATEVQECLKCWS